VFRIVLMVLGVMAAISLGVAVYQTTLTPLNAFETIIKAIGSYFATIITVLGNIVLIFAIIEWALFRTGEKLELKGLPKEKEWDPRSLTKLSPTNRVKMGETIVEIVGCFVVIAIFNFYPQIIGFGFVSGGNWYVGAGNSAYIPLLSEAFFHFVPYMTLVWALTIILDIVLLRMGHWNAVTRICLIGLKIVNIIIVASMLAVPSLLAITSTSLTTALGDAGAARTLMTLLSQIVRVALWITIVGNSIEIIRAISRLATNDIIPQVTGKN
jgi:hypothetical protein